MLPKHIAIIMDGNGRWAKRQKLPRLAGHRAGVEAVRRIVQDCAQKQIQCLTMFAFSSENWQRPASEVSHLLDLMLTVLRREMRKLHKNNVRIRIIGDTTRFSSALQQCIHKAELLTLNNTGLQLTIAANYGGRWDIAQALRCVSEQVKQGQLNVEDINEQMIARHLSTAGLPEPDLFIRTSGEKRISNFLLWQLAYTELYFTDTLWPDFDLQDLEQALASFAARERRFGTVNEPIYEECSVE